MKKALNDFWSWLNISPEEYAVHDIEYTNDHMEFDYPKFEMLKKMAFKIIDSDIMDDDQIYDVLTVMAIDNEEECVLDYIEENSSSEQLQRIVAIGVSHMQPNTRWQVAELVFRRCPKNYIDFLRQLSNDSHFYVKQRANNCIKKLIE